MKEGGVEIGKEREKKREKEKKKERDWKNEIEEKKELGGIEEFKKDIEERRMWRGGV